MCVRPSVCVSVCQSASYVHDAPRDAPRTRRCGHAATWRRHEATRRRSTHRAAVDARSSSRCSRLGGRRPRRRRAQVHHASEAVRVSCWMSFSAVRFVHGDGPRPEQRSTRAGAGVSVSVGGDGVGGEQTCMRAQVHHASEAARVSRSIEDELPGCARSGRGRGKHCRAAWVHGCMCHTDAQGACTLCVRWRCGCGPCVRASVRPCVRPIPTSATGTIWTLLHPTDTGGATSR